jgi:predicted transcriptional regulator
MRPQGVYKIVPGEQGNPIVLDVGRNLSLFPTRSFASVPVAIDALKEHARERGWRVRPVLTHGDQADTFEVYPATVTLEVTVTKDFDDALQLLADRANVTKAEVIRRAVNQYKITEDARAEGKRILIADDESEQEILGF